MLWLGQGETRRTWSSRHQGMGQKYVGEFRLELDSPWRSWGRSWWWSMIWWFVLLFYHFEKCLTLRWWRVFVTGWLKRLPDCLSATINGVSLSVCLRKCFFGGLAALDADLAEETLLVDFKRIQNTTPCNFSVFLNNSKISLLCVGTLSCTQLPPASCLLQKASFCFASFLATLPHWSLRGHMSCLSSVQGCHQSC